mgnify:CR=1 FL=1
MKSFIFVNHQGNHFDYERFINAGITLWRYLHRKLSQNLYEIKELGELKNDTLIIAEESKVTQKILLKYKNNKIIFINFESPLYLQKVTLQQNASRVDFSQYRFPVDEHEKIVSQYETAISKIKYKTKVISLVASNKFRGKIDRFCGNFANFKGYLRNETWQHDIKSNLNRRERFIIQCSRSNTIDVVGSHWHLFLPAIYLKNVRIIPRIEDKRKFLLDYKFTVAFENIEKSGYFTEKIPEAIMCGVCPIVPDNFINIDLVPEGLFYTETEFLADPDKCWTQFLERFVNLNTLTYLINFSVECVGNEIIKNEALKQQGLSAID